MALCWKLMQIVAQVMVLMMQKLDILGNCLIELNGDGLNEI